MGGKSPVAINTPIYMDYHSTTPVDPRVLEEMLPYFSQEFGNAASTDHIYGSHALEAVGKGGLGTKFIYPALRGQ